VAEDEHQIRLTGPADVLEPLIDAGDLARCELDGDDVED
jgi:hypothetical protein